MYTHTHTHTHTHSLTHSQTQDTRRRSKVASKCYGGTSAATYLHPLGSFPPSPLLRLTGTEGESTRERARASERERECVREQGTEREGWWGWEGERQYFHLVSPSFPHHMTSQIEEDNGNDQRGRGRRRRASDKSGASRCPPPA